MKIKWLKPIFLFILLCLSSNSLCQGPPLSKQEKEDKEQDLATYLEDYRIHALDFKRDILYNYYLDIFLRVAKEKENQTFENDIVLALKYFKKAQNLKDKERLVILKSVFESVELENLSKERVSALYTAIAQSTPGFSKMMSNDIRVYLDKLEIDKIRFVVQKGILAKTMRDNKDDTLVKLYCRILFTRSQFKTCFDVLEKVKDVVKPSTFQNMQIETLLYEGDIKFAKILLDSAEVDLNCLKPVSKEEDLMLQRNVAIFHRVTGEFKKSLDCLAPLEKNPNTKFYYYFDGMKASRLLDKKTAGYLFKKAAQYANRKASKFLNSILDWEEVKNSYSNDSINMKAISDVIDTAKYQGFRPILVAADNLKQNIRKSDDKLVKHQKLKYLELLDIYWLVTLKDIEKKRRKSKK